jgi:pentatricopeptide repeat protein
MGQGMSDKVLKEIQGYARAGRVRFIPHAYDQMRERCVRVDDALHALASSTACVLQENGRWRVEGPDLEGDTLTLIVVVESGVLVVTVY